MSRHIVYLDNFQFDVSFKVQIYIDYSAFETFVQLYMLTQMFIYDEAYTSYH